MMLKHFLELGKQGNISSKEIINQRELEVQNIARDADYWAVYETEVTNADGIIFVSAKKKYLINRHFRSGFKKYSVNEFIAEYPYQTAIINSLKDEGCKNVWIKSNIGKIIVYSAKDTDEPEQMVQK